MSDARQRTTTGNWFRYGLRFLGLIGAFAAVFGLIFYFSSNDFPETNAYAAIRSTIERELSKPTIDGVMLIVGVAGTAIAAVWLVLELLMGLVLVTGRRAAVGGNAYMQVFLAAALLFVVNAVAFRHYSRYDCTRDRQFTLPDNLVQELHTLANDSPTDVVVLQLHKSAIGRGQDQDNIDNAAELKVVEKVNDLVDQLRELGPRLRVTVLDKRDDYFPDKVDKLPEELREALKAAPEDSIFFHSNKRVRRMSFSDFYRLDKTASRKTEEVATPDGRTEQRVRTTNLVLLPQGRDEFVKRLLSLEQRKPRIGLLVIHPLLSTRKSSDMYSAAGVRKSLEANGFEVQDVLIKKLDNDPPVPAALTYEEDELDDLESEVEYYSLLVQDREMAVKVLSDMAQQVPTMSLSELNRRFRRVTNRSIETESDRASLAESLKKNIEIMNKELAEFRGELAGIEPKYQEKQLNEKAVEGRRMTDVAAKLRQIVDGCDLLIIPRLTTVDLADRYIVPAELYTMPKEQVEVIKAFLKEGKPVLACFGPTKFGGQGDAEADDLEKLFTRLGFEFGSQTIIADEEARGSLKRPGEGLGKAVERPLLSFDLDPSKEPANPIRQTYLVAARSADGKLELRESGPRAVSLSARAAARSKFAGAILQSEKKTWNEERPIPARGYTPKYEATKIDDPKKGTPDEKRRGPFPVGAALETKVPAEWFDEKIAAAQASSGIGAAAGGLGLGVSTLMLDPDAFAGPGQLPERPSVRIAAFGHGGLFVGKELSPAQEQLLLSTINWQLRRDDMLPKDAPAGASWQFPRVEMSEQQKKLWRWGTFLGLPMLCSFVGLTVLMTRKIR